MLIINADDWGRSQAETAAALACFRAGRVTSVSAMVFMEDSERAANLAVEHGVDVGLHLNLNQPFNGSLVPKAVLDSHNRIVRFMRATKYAQLLYHPSLRQTFREVYQSQLDEFIRLFGRVPSHVDGHQHRHLCVNMLLDEIIPEGEKVRRNFSFWPGEKSWVNRTYRRWVDSRLARRYRITDFLFNLAQCLEGPKLARVFALAQSASVELETHPCKAAEFALLMSEEFEAKLHEVDAAPYARL